MVERAIAHSYRAGRKVVIALVGGAVLLAGIVMIVLPGPAIVAIPAGLGILALEFEWAERWLAWARERSRSALDRWRRARAEHSSDDTFGES
jgi:tellurite resistance protein TerC